MVTITIPNDVANPFVVIVNGRRYEYEAGVTVEVPDEVAEIIANSISLRPRQDSAASGSNNVSYADIVNQSYFRGLVSSNAEIHLLQGTPNDFAYSMESGTIWKYSNEEGWHDTAVAFPDLGGTGTSGGTGGGKLYLNRMTCPCDGDTGSFDFDIYSKKPLKAEDLHGYPGFTFMGTISVEDYANNNIYSGMVTVNVYPYNQNEVMFSLVGFGNSGGSVIAISKMEVVTHDKITVYSVEV